LARANGNGIGIGIGKAKKGRGNMLNINDIPCTSESMIIPAQSIEEAVRFSLEKKRFILEPRLLNPFLKCLENMKRTAAIELNFTFSQVPYYEISFSNRAKGETHTTISE